MAQRAGVWCCLKGWFIFAWLGWVFFFPLLEDESVGLANTSGEGGEGGDKREAAGSGITGIRGTAGIRLGECLGQASEGKNSPAASSSPPIPSSKAHGRDLHHWEMICKVISLFLATSSFQSYPSLAGGCRGPAWGSADVASFENIVFFTPP